MKSQSIDFKHAFAEADIPSGDPVFIEIHRYFNSDGGKCDVVLRLNNSLYGQSKAARIWYESFNNGLLDCGFVVRKAYPCMFMYKNMISVLYVDDCLFWARLKSDIDNVMNYFKYDVTS